MSSLKNSYNRIGTQERTPFIRALTADGTKEGDDNLNVNGAITPVEFWTTPDIDKVTRIQNLILSISDGGAPDIDDYGNITGGLPNGLQFFVDIGGPGGERILLLPNIKTNDDVVKSATLVSIQLFATNVRIITYQKRYYTFSDGVELDGRRGDTFGIIIQDDCSTLLHHHLTIEGFNLVAQV